MAIDITSNFNVGAALPIDARTTAANTTVRDAIPSGKRFLGLQCYVASDTKTYVLKAGITNADWVELGASGGATAITELTGDVTATGPGSSIATISDLPFSKLLSTTPNQAIISDATGKLQNSGVTTTELNLLSGKTTLATIAGVESLTNKTLIDPNTTVEIFADQASTPAAPAAGKTKVYTKTSDGNLYKLNSAGVESVIGTGSITNTGSVTVKDTNFTLQDDADVTKQARFELSGIPTATTRTYTLPNSNSTLADIGSAQTFVSKTLTSPTISGANMIMGTATNSNRIGIASGTTAVLNALSNVAGLIAYDSTLNKMVYNDATQWNAIGGRGGFINYAGSVWDGTAPAKFVPYKEAGAIPATALGGTTTGITAALNATLPLSGTQNIRLSKSAANLLGGGWAFSLIIDRAYLDRGTPINIRVQTRASANYVAGDVKIYVIDVTTSAVQAVLTNNADSSISTGTSEFQGQFFPSINASYRLAFHITSTNALAWDLDLAQLVVSPQATVPNSVATATIPYSPVINGFGTIASQNIKYAQHGDKLLIEGEFVAGTPGATPAELLFPTGYVGPTLASALVVGKWWRSNSTANIAKEGTLIVVTGGTQLYFGNGEYASATGPNIAQNGNQIVATGERVYIQAVVTTTRSTGNVISTTDALISSARFTARKTATQSIATTAATKVTWQSVATDNLAAWDAANNRYIIKKLGRFFVSAQFEVSSFAGIEIVSIYVNGAEVRRSYNNSINTIGTLLISAPLDLFVNDYVEIFASGNDAAYDIAGPATATWFSIDQLPDLSTFGTTGRFEILSASSSLKTPTASGNFSAMTGNSIPLSVGTWSLKSQALFSQSGSAGYSDQGFGWYGANGADTTTQPVVLGTVSGITVLSAGDTSFVFRNQLASGVGTLVSAPGLELIVRVTIPTTVYLVPRSDQTTSANARLAVYATAERKQ